MAVKMECNGMRPLRGRERPAGAPFHGIE